MKLIILEKGRKAVPIGTRRMLPGGKYYQEKTATGWKHVRVERTAKGADEEDKKKNNKKDDDEKADKEAIEDKLNTLDKKDISVTTINGKTTEGKLTGGVFSVNGTKVIRMIDKDGKIVLIGLEAITGVKEGQGEASKGKDEAKDGEKGSGASTGQDSTDTKDSKDEKKAPEAKKGRGRPKGSKNKADGTEVTDKKINDKKEENKPAAPKIKSWLKGERNLTFDEAVQKADKAFEIYKKSHDPAEYEGIENNICKTLGISDMSGLKEFVQKKYNNESSGDPETMAMIKAQSYVNMLMDNRNYGQPSYTAAVNMNRILKAYQQAAFLNDPTWDGKLFLGSYGAFQFGFITVGMRGTTEHGNHLLTEMNIDYADLNDFLTTFIENDQATNIRKTLAKRPEYKQWLLTSDANMAAAAKHFKDTTGLEFVASQSSRKSVGMSDKNLKAVEKIFEGLKPVMDMTKYTPPDGSKLKVTTARAVKGAAGFYNESSLTINISPTMPGTVTHEVGHYFWNRDPAIQPEFMKWVHESGLYDKILNNLKSPEKNKDVWIPHIRNQFNHAFHELTDSTNGRATFGKGSWSYVHLVERNNIFDEDTYESFSDGINDMFNMYRGKMEGDATMIAEGRGKPVLIETGTLYDNLRNADDRTLINMAVNAMNYEGFSDKYKTSDELYAKFKLVSKGLKALHTNAKDMYEAVQSDTSWMIRIAKEAPDTVHHGEYYRSKRGYWLTPTEIFARTFRNYCAFKGGRKIHDSTPEQNKEDKGYVIKDVKRRKTGIVEQKVESTRTKDIYGWGFPEVDANEDMLKFDDGRLEKILKKYIGADVVKSMVRMAMNLQKSDKRMLAIDLSKSAVADRRNEK